MRVKELRLATGLSQEVFADKCGFARTYMSRIETGVANPSLDAIETLATGVKVPIELFFQAVSGPPRASVRNKLKAN